MTAKPSSPAETPTAATPEPFDSEHHAGMGSGNALRAGVLGANDGLVSILSLVMGVAGAAFDSSAILVTGLAGVLAGACSMAMGEWISVTSSRELYSRQLEEERIEIRDNPERELQELIRLYERRGVRHEIAVEVATAIMKDPDTALDVMAREEFGFDPDDLGGSALVAAVSSFALFVVGAVPPILPFAFLEGSTAVITSLVLSGLALLVIGGLITQITGRSPVFSAVRQLVIGLGAAGVTYAIGASLGVSIV
ncbi:MAG: VIT1/CCC1 transporter family protein [Solirubrobacteraceae bacterium]|nr:VIT1/CCC1 transporter family protein [Solirubrobacteraceae bacterium]